jgi:hypothetical protein
LSRTTPNYPATDTLSDTPICRSCIQEQAQEVPADEVPNGFQRFRGYGFLGNRYRQEKRNQCRILIRHADAGTTHGAFARARLRRSLRRSHRLFVAPVSSMPWRSHGGGCNPAAIFLQLSKDGRLVMIHHRLRTRNSMGSASPGPRRSVVQLQADSRIPCCSPTSSCYEVSRPPQSPNPHRPDQQSAGKRPNSALPPQHGEITQHP